MRGTYDDPLISFIYVSNRAPLKNRIRNHYKIRASSIYIFLKNSQPHPVLECVDISKWDSDVFYTSGIHLEMSARTCNLQGVDKNRRK